jgi:bacterioferritin
MKGDAKVIDYLNAALRSELTAVSQYWLHYRLQEDWGFGHLADKSRAESIEEMHHADRLIARIIFLEGHPNLQRHGATATRSVISSPVASSTSCSRTRRATSTFLKPRSASSTAWAPNGTAC